MRKVYLASDSKARKKLLENLGLKFTVLPNKIKEKRNLGGLSYARLVKINALRKAKEASGKIKHGIIISADTITVQDKKIFGKPKDLKEARSMLKRISQKPQWLYTGIAVIDKDNNKSIVDCEKTKVFMDKLTDKEIVKYFKQVSPLDKAGSFDIQGKGAFFISRIEGCFYNVVGLPINKLYSMLKRIKVNIFGFLLATWCLGSLVTFLSGCSTEYNIVTKEEETFYYSTDKEIEMGIAISKEIEKEYELVDDPLVQERVRVIGEKIASACDRKDVDYHFIALADEEINAFALPGGFVYVNKGLIDKVNSDDELACVLAHEVGHIVARHSIKKLQALQGYSILRILIAATPKPQEVGTAADMAFLQIISGYSREDELLADQLSTRYAKLAGYNPYAMIDFLERLHDINRRKPLRPKSYFKTHPYALDRIRVVKQELGERIGFKDYINIEEEPHN